MTRFVRNPIASTSLAILALIAAGCGGGDDAVTVVDAAADAPTDAPPDAPPLVCNAPTMNCSGECVNVNTDEQHCGDCTTVCTAGQICNGSCACPNITIGATLNGGIGAEAMGAFLGSSEVSGDALVVVIDPLSHTLDQDYTLTEAGLGTLPLAGFAVGLNLLSGTPSTDAAFAATEGTLRITNLCRPTQGSFPPDGAIVGTLTNVKFSAVDGLLTGNPVIVPGGCTIPSTGTIPSIAFSLGTVACTSSAQ